VSWLDRFRRRLNPYEQDQFCTWTRPLAEHDLKIPNPKVGGLRPAEKRGGVWVVPDVMPVAESMAPMTPAPVPINLPMPLELRLGLERLNDTIDLAAEEVARRRGISIETARYGVLRALEKKLVEGAMTL